MQCPMNTNLAEQMEANSNVNVVPLNIASKSSKAELPSQPDGDGNILCNVHCSGYDTPSTLTFVGCRLENRHFINCKFQDTEFRNAKLANVVFINIDLGNVTIYDVDLKVHSWKDIVARNLVLVPSALLSDAEGRVTSLRPLCNRHLTHTMIETRQFERLSPEVAKRLSHHEKGFHHSIRVEQLPRPRLLDRLMDHEHIITRIVNSLLLSLVDCKGYARRLQPILESSPRYKLACIVTIWHQVPQEPSKAPGTIYLHCPTTTGSLRLATLVMLHTNQHVQIRFEDYCQGPLRGTQCHVSEAGLSSSHINFAYLRSAKTVALHYNFEGDQGFIKTDDESWHRLMVHIRHEASYIAEIHLIIDKHFWARAVWRQGVSAVMSQNDLRNSLNRRNYPNFLVKIAKIAAPGSRWHDHDLKKRRRSEDDNDTDEDGNHCAHGTRLKLFIDGTVSDEQEAFAHELAGRIEEMRIKRPLFRSCGTYTREPRPWWI